MTFITPTIPFISFRPSQQLSISHRPHHPPTATAIHPIPVRTILPPPTVDVFTDDGPFIRPRLTTPPRPVVIVPGYGASASHYETMAECVREHLGSQAYVIIAPLTYRHWLHTVGGRPVMSILRVIDTAVQQAVNETGVDDVTIVAHSAAGWISRIYLGNQTYPEQWVRKGEGGVKGVGGVSFGGERFVGTLLCLGTPHKSREFVARHNMRFVNEVYPGAFCKSVRYLNFAGDGGSLEEVGGKWWRVWERDWFTKTSYRLTDGLNVSGQIVGDGIVPMNSAFLENAQENILLKGVWHAPISRGPWYGHPRVVEYWSSFLR